MEISTISDGSIYHRDNNDQSKLEAKKDIQDDEIDFLQQISMLNDVEGSRGGEGGCGLKSAKSCWQDCD